MGDVFTPGDDIFILVEDSFDIVLVADDNQGRKCEDDNGKDDIVAWEIQPVSGRMRTPILAKIATVTLEKEIMLVK